MSDVEVFILAGGKSSRMGKDKGLISLMGKPMVKHLLEKIDKLGIEANIISANPEYQAFKIPIYKDIIPNLGPIGGLLTSLHFSKKNNVLLLSCDTPLIPISAIRKLTENEEEAAMYITSVAGQLNPVFGIYSKSILPKVFEQIEKGDFKMKNLIFSNRHAILNLDYLASQNPLAFTNFNTMQDIERFDSLENSSTNIITGTQEKSKW